MRTYHMPIRADRWTLQSLAAALVEVLPQAPDGSHTRTEFLRGFVDGYLGRPYEAVVEQDDPIFVAPSDNPYRRGYHLGGISRVSRN